LAASFASTTGTWASLALGHLGDPLNTFWQLFYLAGGSSHWALATPPGVASNGGLVASVGPFGSLTAGFGASIKLRFSPLAQSTDHAASWSPGVVPGALVPEPDALATSSDSRYLALLAGGGGAVVASAGDLSTWNTVALSRSLAAATSSSGCRIEALTAVAFLPDGEESVGAACARGQQAGVFVLRQGRWQSIGPSVPSGNGPSQVIRLLGTARGAAALVSTGSGRSRRLFGAWSTDGLATWSISAPLPALGGSLVSSGVTASGGLIAVTEGAGPIRTAAVVGPTGSGWQRLAPLPPRTAVVAGTPDGGYDALVEDQSTLRVDALGPAGWHQVQTVGVPIQYGSSG
jgi:hypothetical protein